MTADPIAKENFSALHLTIDGAKGHLKSVASMKALAQKPS
jgi:hypothetical protein